MHARFELKNLTEETIQITYMYMGV